MNYLISALGGKKYTSVIIGIISVILIGVFKDRLGLSEEATETMTLSILGMVGAHNVGQGIADGLTGGKTSHLTEKTAVIKKK